MSRATDRLGSAGERYAADYLQRHGYRIVDRNVRRREGELDLVAVDGGCTVFVEVKTRRPGVQGGAIEAVSEAKGRRLAMLAEAYAAEHPELPADLRIDLVAVDLAADGSVASLRHVQNAVEGYNPQ